VRHRCDRKGAAPGAHFQEIFLEVTLPPAARLRKEINYWDHRAQDLKTQERAGRKTRLSSANAEARANDLAERLQRRMEEIRRQRDISALPPVVRGGALVVPAGLLRPASTDRPAATTFAEERETVERLAMEAVMAAESALGFEPHDVSAQRVGYDIESREPGSGHLRFIEVKGGVEGADTVTVTRNEIITALNEPNAFVLAIVQVNDGFAQQPRYVRQPFRGEPNFGPASVTYSLAELTARGEPPR
jgi:hypothetical protein